MAKKMARHRFCLAISQCSNLRCCCLEDLFLLTTPGGDSSLNSGRALHCGAVFLLLGKFMGFSPARHLEFLYIASEIGGDCLRSGQGCGKLKE
jgi:hypothetical protein